MAIFVYTILGSVTMLVGIVFGYVLGHHASVPKNTDRDDDE